MKISEIKSKATSELAKDIGAMASILIDDVLAETNLPLHEEADASHIHRFLHTLRKELPEYVNRDEICERLRKTLLNF
jgi:hypothetical protein